MLAKSRLLAMMITSSLTLSHSALAAIPEITPRNDTSPMGINVSGIADWSTAIPFVNVFKSSRPFHDVHPELQLDEQGWIKSLGGGQVGETFMMWDINGMFPSGEYTVLYDGDGVIKYGGGARLIKRDKGRDVINVNADTGGIHFKLTVTDPKNYIRNVRVLLPGGICKSEPLKRVNASSTCENKDFMSFEGNPDIVFNPDFLRELSDFKVLRYLDMLAVNNSTQQSWQDRTLPSRATWSGSNGGPMEVMVALANTLNADPWFCVPHLASNEYVTQMASYIRDNLKPGLKAYIEYSNETWNGQFKQNHYMLDQGAAMKIEGDRYQAAVRFYSKRAVEVFKLFESAFGGTDRLVRVMAGQAANAYIVSTALEYEDAYKHTDAIAIAPYIGGDLGDPDRHTEQMNIASLFDTLRATSLPESVDWIKAHAPVAKKYNVDLLAYEGGHHLAGIRGAENNAALNKLFDAADNNPQMATLYARYMDEWKKAGGKTFVYYQATSRHSKWGRWGIRQHLEQAPEDAPKYKAVLDFIKQNPRWW